MKSISKIILPCVAFGLSAVACNDIEPADRFIDLPAVESGRVVLLEDYTGQSCTNCPDAHAVMEQLLEQYPGQLVGVSIHAGPFAASAETTSYGLKQAFGDQMAADRGFTSTTSYPKGIIDGGEAAEYENWPTLVYQALQKPSYCELAVGQLAVAQNEQGKNVLSGEVVVTPGSSFVGKLAIWVLEDGIVARQNNHGVLDRNYVHNHVMRAYASNDVWGDEIELNREEVSTHQFSVELNDKWNTANLSVVAFVTNTQANGEYVQTVLAKVN
jgi:thiol-disulfide isomerase/thioredoxin